MRQRRDKHGRFTKARTVRRKSSRTHKPIAESMPASREHGLPPSDNLLTFQQVLGLNAWFYAAVMRLASATASVPYRLIRSDTDEDFEGAKADDVREVLQRVNDYQSSYDFREACVVHLGTDGEMIVEKARGAGGRGQTVELHVWNPGYCHHIPDLSGKRPIAKWLFRWQGKTTEIDAEDVIYCRFYNPTHPYRGLAPISSVRAEISGDIAAAGYNKNLIARGMRPGGILVPKDGDLDDDSWARLQQAVKQQINGFQDAGNMLAMPSGMEFIRDNITPREMDFLGSRKFTREAVAAALGVAPMMIQNFDSATYANSEQQLKAFWDYMGVPLLMKMFGAFNEHWIHREYGAEISLAPDLVAIAAQVDSEKTRVQNAQLKLNGGIITINEARAELGYKPIPDGGKLLIQGALVPMAPDAIENPLSAGIGIESELPAETEAPAVDPNELETVEEFVLNGAQIQAAFTIVAAVAAGEIPRDSGIGSLVVMFNLTPEQAEKIMGSAGLEDVPTTPNPKPHQEQEGQEGPTDDEDGSEDAPPREEGTPSTGEDEDPALAERRARLFGLNGVHRNGRGKGVDRDAVKRAHAKGLREARRRVGLAVRGALVSMRARVLGRLRKLGGVPEAAQLIPNVREEAATLFRAIAPALLAVMREAGEATLRRVGFETSDRGRSWEPTAGAFHLKQGVGISFTVNNPAIRNYLDKHLWSHLYKVSQAALDQLGKVIEEHRLSQAAGEGVSELAARLRDLPIFGGARADVIAHTETLAAVGTASYEAFQAAETPRKSWLSTGRRTRFSHAQAEIETSAHPIPTDQPFILREPGRGVAECRFPGDPLAPGWAAIKCACTLVPEAAEDDERATAFARHYARKCAQELTEKAGSTA